MGGPVALYKAFEEILPWARLFNRNGEGDLGGKFGCFDNVFGDLSPAPADAGAGDDALPRRPGVLGGLDAEEDFPEKLLRHVGPTTLSHAVADTLSLVLHRTMRPRSHASDYTHLDQGFRLHQSFRLSREECS